MDDLHVDTELAAAVVEDKDANAAAAGVEGGLETLPQVGLVHDGKVLLDVAGLGHGDNCCSQYTNTFTRGIDPGVWDKRCNLLLPSCMSRTRYCLKTGPSIVWTTTLGAG